MNCRRFLPRDNAPTADQVAINATEQILDLAWAPERDWDCEGTLVILAGDEGGWASAARCFPQPATTNVRLQQVSLLCDDLGATAHSLFGYRPIHGLVAGLYSESSCRFIAEFDCLDDTARQGLVTLAHLMIDTAAGDFGSAAASISKRVSVLVRAPFPIDQFAYGALGPGLSVAGIFKSMEEWNAARPLRNELAARGIPLIAHVGAAEAERQAVVEQIASAIANDEGRRSFVPKSDTTFVTIRDAAYTDLIANEYEMNPGYEDFDPETITTVREWRHDTFSELCKWVQIYEHAALEMLGWHHDPPEAARRLRMAINRGDLPKLARAKLSCSPENSLQHGLQTLLRKIAHRKAFSAGGSA